jgi:hypothetical protein
MAAKIKVAKVVMGQTQIGQNLCTQGDCRGNMRKEFYETFPPFAVAGFTLIGTFASVFGIFALTHPAPGSTGLGLLLLAFSMLPAIQVFRALRWRKKNKTRPLIIIDDTGLWHRKLGELIPWSEIQSIEYWAHPGTGASDIRVVYRHERHSLPSSSRWQPLNLMDSDGHRAWNSSVCKEIKACWERNRDASAVSVESDQVAPSGS